MVAVDAIVVYIQSTPNFPSWTSRVRSPSPALSKQELTDTAQRAVLQNTPLSILDCPLQHVHRFVSSSQVRNRVDILIHVECMPELIRDELWLDLELVHERRMRPAHHLKVHPVKSRFLDRLPIQKRLKLLALDRTDLAITQVATDMERNPVLVRHCRRSLPFQPMHHEENVVNKILDEHLGIRSTFAIVDRPNDIGDADFA